MNNAIKFFSILLTIIIITGFASKGMDTDDSPKILLSIIPQEIDGHFSFIIENIGDTPVKIPSLFAYPSDVKITTPNSKIRSFAINIDRSTFSSLLPKAKKIWDIDVFLKILDSGISEEGEYELSWNLYVNNLNFQSNKVTFSLRKNNCGYIYNDLSLTFKVDKKNKSIIATLKNNRNHKLTTSDFNSDDNYIKMISPSGQKITNRESICCSLRIIELSPKEERFWEIKIDSLFSLEHISPEWKYLFQEKGDYQLQWYIRETTDYGHMGREFYSEPIKVTR